MKERNVHVQVINIMILIIYVKNVVLNVEHVLVIQNVWHVIQIDKEIYASQNLVIMKQVNLPQAIVIIAVKNVMVNQKIIVHYVMQIILDNKLNLDVHLNQVIMMQEYLKQKNATTLVPLVQDPKIMNVYYVQTNMRKKKKAM